MIRQATTNSNCPACRASSNPKAIMAMGMMIQRLALSVTSSAANVAA